MWKENMVILESRGDFSSLPHVNPHLSVVMNTKFGKFVHFNSLLKNCVYVMVTD